MVLLSRPWAPEEATSLTGGEPKARCSAEGEARGHPDVTAASWTPSVWGEKGSAKGPLAPNLRGGVGTTSASRTDAETRGD